MKQLLVILTASFMLFTACGKRQQAVSDSGVKKATVQVTTDLNGHSVEQNNYIKRVTEDNKIGSIKHLYVISAYTGDVLEYSTVNGKVTSGAKRLSPTTVTASALNSSQVNSNWVTLNGLDFTTSEVPDEYGMYGSSSPYFYWFDAQGNYHQYYPSGGTYVHISDRPLRVKKANMTFEIESVK